MIDWQKELRSIYVVNNPGRLDDLEGILNEAVGAEEALYVALISKYSCPHRMPDVLPLPTMVTSSTSSAKLRVVRMYARYAPEKLRDVAKTLSTMEELGPTKVFELLTEKYGPEPPAVESAGFGAVSFKERLLILYGYYDRPERIGALDQLLGMYKGMEEGLLRRTMLELGPEPSDQVKSHPMEYRQRLTRIFKRYDPSLLSRVELLLNRYQNQEVHLFAQMQSRYGREPSDYDLLVWERRLAQERARMAEEEVQRRQEERLRAEESDVANQLRNRDILKEIGALKWQVISDGIEEHDLPPGAKRSAALTICRDRLSEGVPIPRDKLTALFRSLAQYYDRDYLSEVDKLVDARYQLSDESIEFVSFLEFVFTNALPANFAPRLREVASLLEMQLGADFEAAFLAGGVERFVSRCAGREQEWVLYLHMLHGVVTEETLASRNRLRAYYLQYNPGTPVAEIDAVLSKFGKDPTTVFTVLQQTYGPEPPPLAVDIARVQRVLQRNNASRLAHTDIVIEAHTMIGDTADQVFQRICRTYGPEPNALDSQVYAFLAFEMEERFRLFATEMRLRLLHFRQLQSLRFPEYDVLGSIVDGEVRRTTGDEVAARRKMAATATPAAIQVFAEEYESRRCIEMRESIEANEIFGVAEHRAKTYVAEETADPDVRELVERVCIQDDALVIYPLTTLRMQHEERELMKWLQTRLVWRAKWKREGEEAGRGGCCASADVTQQDRGAMSAVAQEAEEERQRYLHAQAVAAANATSDSHLDIMTTLKAQLHEQASKVLSWEQEVLIHRRRFAKGQEPLLDVLIDPKRPPHRGCAFHAPHYVAATPGSIQNPPSDGGGRGGTIVGRPRGDSNVAAASPRVGAAPGDAGEGGGVDDDDVDWERVFQRQVEEYVTELVRVNSPENASRVKDELFAFRGKECDLVVSLEEQFDVADTRRRTWKRRIEAYYERVAPSRMESEAPRVVERFADRPADVWPYLTTRFGVAPDVRAKETTAYLQHRLMCYVGRVAPHLLPQVDAMIDRCYEHNADAVFKAVADEYGPEDPRLEAESIARKLLTFYRNRHIHVTPGLVQATARRFAGRQELLNEILRRKFGGPLDDEIHGGAEAAAMDPTTGRTSAPS